MAYMGIAFIYYILIFLAVYQYIRGNKETMNIDLLNYHMVHIHQTLLCYPKYNYLGFS